VDGRNHSNYRLRKEFNTEKQVLLKVSYP
jgi:hypothetical protein